MAHVIPASLGTSHWSNEHCHGCFRPRGTVLVVPVVDGATPNPASWRSAGKETLAARIFVGFNVGGKARWDVDDLVRVVRETREEEHQKPDASFVAQKGIYTHHQPGKRAKVIEEDGAQVVIIRMPGESDAKFRRNMVALAETIAERMHQAEVVLELQRGGVVQQVMGVTA